MVKLELLTKQGCHLCEDARATLDEVAEEFGVDWTEVDAADRPDLAEQFAEEIPVLFVDGAQRDFWRIDERRLRLMLENARKA